MKLLTNLSLIAATVVILGSSAAFADDPQLQNRLAVQRAQDSAPASTVALYSVQNRAGGGAPQCDCAGVRLHSRSDAHGHAAGLYESVR